MVLNNYDIIIVGCGLSGIVIAERFSFLQNKKILIIDKRNHIGGNCYDYYDKKTNILMNKYGAHLFHTNDEEVFNYISQYGNWSAWEHKVLGLIDDKYLPIPVNITTVNEIFNLDIKNKKEMDEWLSENHVKYENITNGEEMAKSRVGEILYEKIFKNYTYKQWKKYPNELAPEVLARIPVKNTFDDRYFSDKYQVLPEKGYTAFFQSILDKHKHNIDVKLNCDFFDIKDQITKKQIVIYTGPIDTYFSDKGLPKLEYRSIDFHIKHKMNTDFYQPCSVVNYPSADTPYTRCVEYKHFLNQKSDHTVYVKETTTDKGEPYYPVLNDKNKELYKKYQKMAEEEGENIHFIGRLASYKYFNMDQAIKNSLDYYKEYFECKI
jgi:UDP-galactopyranose mutase